MCLLFSQLKEKLSEYFPIPTDGIIAGGAVASAYFDIHPEINIKSRYKDLDLFVEAKSDLSKYSMNRNKEIDIAVGYASGVGEFTKTIVKHGYRIMDSAYDLDTGINTISVKYYNDDDNKALSVINGFDINAVSISMDLASETVVIHPDFLEFIKTVESIDISK